MNFPDFRARCRFRSIVMVASSLALVHGAGAGEESWKEISRTPTLTLYERAHAGSSYKEVKAVGTFDAPNWVVKNVLDDAEHYPKFMPHLTESRVLERDPGKHTLTVYAQLDPPVISKRDYAITVHDDSHREAEGAVYHTYWAPATDAKVPTEKTGFVRVKVNEGSWLLEPTDGGQHTRGTYILYTDGGGGVPAFVLNGLNKRRLTELFEALAKQAKDDKYTQQGKPAFP